MTPCSTSTRNEDTAIIMYWGVLLGGPRWKTTAVIGSSPKEIDKQIHQLGGMKLSEATKLSGLNSDAVGFSASSALQYNGTNAEKDSVLGVIAASGLWASTRGVPVQSPVVTQATYEAIKAEVLSRRKEGNPMKIEEVDARFASSPMAYVPPTKKSKPQPIIASRPQQ